jgi:hypothetical protein
MTYLNLFTSQNLALLSDWLEETGELYVDVYRPHSASSSSGYLVRSLQELKSLVVKQNDRPEIVFRIFRKQQLPLRGIASEELLEQALEQFPNGEPFYVAYLDYYPEHCNRQAEGDSHSQLRQAIKEEFGELIAIGSPPAIDARIQELDYRDVFEVFVRKNQNYYEPYSREPGRYQSIVEMWHK